jgi:hypothetical protein
MERKERLFSGANAAFFYERIKQTVFRIFLCYRFVTFG